MSKFIAFAVNLGGVALASYPLTADCDVEAEQEVRQYLDRHRTIEVWSQDHRRVARLVRKPE